MWWRNLSDSDLYSDAHGWGPSEGDFKLALAERDSLVLPATAVGGSDGSDTSVSLDFDDEVLKELELLQIGEGDQDERDAVLDLERFHIDNVSEHPPLKRPRTCL